MLARTSFRGALVLGILIGAGGCSSDSPTAPLAPSSSAQSKAADGMIGSGNRNDPTPTSTDQQILTTDETEDGLVGGHIGAGRSAGGHIGAGS